MEPRSVSFVNQYIKSLLESDFALADLSVVGEISDITVHRSGHIYFSLKDESSVLSAVMFRGNAASLESVPVIGDKVVVKGRISAYVPRGNYQIVVTRMTPEGEGDYYRRFLEMKERLEALGMFDAQYKIEIPKYINRLGVVTSPTGAAIKDIINVAGRRNPYVEIILSPALVQGDGAGESIARALLALEAQRPDVIIVGRGGGSKAELWAFNEQVVAEAIFACSIPVISAVGHERDDSISDLVADLRAPTPSAAAELAVYDVYDLIDELSDYEYRLANRMDRAIDDKRQMALGIERRLELLSPRGRIERNRDKLIHIREKLLMVMDRELSLKKEQLKSAAKNLNALSPVTRLAQGYAYVTTDEGRNIKSVTDVKSGDTINARLSDGIVKATVS